MPISFQIQSREEALKTLAQETIVAQIKEINNSVGWSCYNPPIIDDFKDAAVNCFLALQEGSILGYIFTEKTSDLKACIPFMAIHKENQKNGVGTALLRTAIIFTEASALEFECAEKVRSFYSCFAKRESLTYNEEREGLFWNSEPRYKGAYALSTSFNDYR